MRAQPEARTGNDTGHDSPLQDRERVWRQGGERKRLRSRKREEGIEYTAVRWMSGLFAEEEEILTERGGNQSM